MFSKSSFIIQYEQSLFPEPSTFTHTLSNANMQTCKELSNSFFSPQSPEKVILHRLRTSSNYIVSSFMKYVPKNSTTVELKNICIYVYKLETDQHLPIIIDVPNLSIPIKAWSGGQFISINFIELPDNSILILLWFVNNVIIFNVFKDNSEWKYQNIFRKRIDGINCSLYLGLTSSSTLKQTTFYILAKPLNKFIAWTCNYANVKQITIWEHQESESYKDKYKLERFIPSNSRYIWFVEKTENWYLLFDKEHFNWTPTSIEADLVSHSFSVYTTSKNEIWIYTDLLINAMTLQIKVFMVIPSEYNNTSRQIQVMNIWSNNAIENPKWMTSCEKSWSWSWNYGNQMYLLELNDNDKTITNVNYWENKSNIAFSGKNTELSYFDNLDDKTGNVLIVNYNEMKFNYWKFKHKKDFEMNQEKLPPQAAGYDILRKDHDNIVEEQVDKCINENSINDYDVAFNSVRSGYSEKSNNKEIVDWEGYKNEIDRICKESEKRSIDKINEEIEKQWKERVEDISKIIEEKYKKNFKMWYEKYHALENENKNYKQLLEQWAKKVSTFEYLGSLPRQVNVSIPLEKRHIESLYISGTYPNSNNMSNVSSSQDNCNAFTQSALTRIMVQMQNMMQMQMMQLQLINNSYQIKNNNMNYYNNAPGVPMNSQKDFKEMPGFMQRNEDWSKSCNHGSNQEYQRSSQENEPNSISNVSNSNSENAKNINNEASNIRLNEGEMGTNLSAFNSFILNNSNNKNDDINEDVSGFVEVKKKKKLKKEKERVN